MYRPRWGPEGPPAEAYSRVTDPERFRALHAATDALLAGLEASFDVERTDGYGVDDELEASGLARPTVRLLPRDPNAAPLSVAFTTFPGIKLRAGRRYVWPFPSCGCDACDETADVGARLMRELVEDVVEGRFREGVSMSLIGDGWYWHQFWSPHGRKSGRSRIGRKKASAMIAEVGGRRSIEWVPWLRASSRQAR